MSIYEHRDKNIINNEVCNLKNPIISKLLKLLAASAIPFLISSCTQKPERAIQTPESILIQNRRESIRSELMELTSQIDDLQAKIATTSNYERKNLLILKCRDLIIKHQDQYDNLKFEDKQYIKSKPH